MKPVRTPDTNFTYKLQGGTEENDLPCVIRDERISGCPGGDTTSFWALESSDSFSAGPLNMLIQHQGIREIAVGFGDRLDDLTLHTYHLARREEGGLATIDLDEDTQQRLMLGGYFVLQVPGHPTPPVSVWIGSTFAEPERTAPAKPGEHVDVEALSRRAMAALNRLTKWRSFFAGWQLGTQPETHGPTRAVRDHREVTMLLRAEVTALAGLLEEKGVFTRVEFTEALAAEAERLSASYSERFPGVEATDHGLSYSLPEARDTMLDLGFPP